MTIRPKLSTAHHPETDGQTENANAFLKQYLRIFCNFQQDDWVEHLPIAEFVANNTPSSSTQAASFLSVYSFPPKAGTSLSESERNSSSGEIDTDKYAKQHKLRVEECKQYMAWAQSLQQEFANRHRRPAPDFQVGDWVMLDSRYYRSSRPSKSLDHKSFGPYQIVRKIDTLTYKLNIPSDWRIHPVVHAWLLHPASPPTNKPPPRLGPVHQLEGENEQPEWLVQAVVASRINKRKKDPATNKLGLLEYQLHFVGYDDDHNKNPPWQPYRR
jgi:hypothetical protein